MDETQKDNDRREGRARGRDARPCSSSPLPVRARRCNRVLAHRQQAASTLPVLPQHQFHMTSPVEVDPRARCSTPCATISVSPVRKRVATWSMRCLHRFCERRRINACLTLARCMRAMSHTIEGLAGEDELHPMQAHSSNTMVFSAVIAHPDRYAPQSECCVRPAKVGRGHATADLRPLHNLTDARNSRAHERQSLPLRRLPQHRSAIRDAAEVLEACSPSPISGRHSGDSRCGCGGSAGGTFHRRRHQSPGSDEAGYRAPGSSRRHRPFGTRPYRPTEKGGLHIGAQVRNSDLAADPIVRARYPVLSQALLRAPPPRSKQGFDSRQPSPAYAMPLFLRPQHALQQTRTGHRLRRTRGLQPDACGIGTSQACIAVHPSEWRSPWRCSTLQSKPSHREVKRVRSRSEISNGCLARRRTRRHACPRRNDHRITLRHTGGRQAIVSARPRLLRFALGFRCSDHRGFRNRCERSCRLGRRCAETLAGPGNRAGSRVWYYRTMC